MEASQAGPNKQPIKPVLAQCSNEKWADSLIITPNSQPNASPNKSRRRVSRFQGPKSPIQKSQSTSFQPLISPLTSQPLISPLPFQPQIFPLPSQPQPEDAQPEPQLPNLTFNLSTYLFFQTTSTFQPEVPSLDAINVGLGGLEAYDLRDLSQPRGVSDYDYDMEFGEGKFKW